MTDESRFSVEEIQARVDAIKWFHDWPIVPGIKTRGMSPMLERAHYFQIPEDLSGKRVLDIGCAEGYFTFLAESRGAEVVAIDSWPRQGFFLAHEVLGSRAEFHHASVYDLDPEKFGLFDVVFFFGVYYHLKNPVLALERIASVTKEWALIESQIMLPPDQPAVEKLAKFWQRFQRAQPSLPQGAVSYFYEHDEFNGDPTNWWVPDIPCLLQTVRAAGFPRAELVCTYNGGRGIVRAIKGPRTAAHPLAEDLFVVIDVPSPHAQVSGRVEVTGWALSQLHPEDGVEQVWLYLDDLDDPGAQLGEARRGFWRADQTAHFGDRYGACGYKFDWDLTGVTAGPHTLHVLAQGKMGWNYRSVSVVVG
jgi:tRNA (mo5U34)-methyltransferase